MHDTNAFRLYTPTEATSSADETSENALTRAFLTLLRLSPAVQTVFVDAVRASQSEHGADRRIPPRTEGDMTQVQTQVGSVQAQAGRIVSILLINEPWDAGAGEPFAVTAGTDDHIYDGLIHYAGDWVLVLEHKPFGGVRPRQLHPNVEGHDALTVEPTLAVIVWRDLIRGLHAARNRDGLGTTQQRLIDDFLAYVQDVFPELQPFPTFAACRDHRGLLNRRCTAILRALNDTAVGQHKGWKTHLNLNMATVKKVALEVPTGPGDDADWSMELSLHPGDTATQARPFYRQVDVDALVQLQNKGWTCRSNLHFGFASKNLAYPNARPPLADYVQYWRDDPSGWMGKVTEDDFDAMLGDLQAQGFLTDADRAGFESKFVDTGRTSADVRPGLTLHYRWPKAEAETLDAAGRAPAVVADAVRTALATWREAAAWDDWIEA